MLKPRIGGAAAASTGVKRASTALRKSTST
jgi:hypothetical protein